MWAPRNLKDHLEEGNPVPSAIARDERVPVDEFGNLAPRGRGRKVVCPSCGVKRHAFQLVDVRHLPIPEEFACDGCWTAWEREGRDVTGNPSPMSSHAEWKERWVEALGAPQEIIDYHRTRRGNPRLDTPYNGRAPRRA